VRVESLECVAAPLCHGGAFAEESSVPRSDQKGGLPPALLVPRVCQRRRLDPLRKNVMSSLEAFGASHRMKIVAAHSAVFRAGITSA